MKKSSLVMMIVGLGLSVAGAVCLIIGFWDKLTTLCGCVGKTGKKVFRPKEYDDFADVD